MYLSRDNEETQRGVLHQLMVDQPLGTWVSLHGEEMVVNHIPFLLAPAKGLNGTLMGHVARANPVWKSLVENVESVIIFQGPQGYISPSWYPSKQQHGKAVPTWNYITVHARGMPKVIQDSAGLREHLSAMTHTHEHNQSQPWQLSDAPESYISTMVDSIVGIEIPIDHLVGKWKLGQNRSKADQKGMIIGLQASNNRSANDLAEEITCHLNNCS